MKKYITLALFLSSLLPLTAADELPSTLLISGAESPNPRFLLNGRNATLKEHLMGEKLPAGLALVYDSGSATGGTAAYTKITATTWREIPTSTHGHLLAYIDAGKWFLFHVPDTSGITHCLFFGSADPADAISRALSTLFS